MAVGLVWPGLAAGLVTVTGHARHPVILDQPAAGYVELYEYNVWLTADGFGENHVRRTGAPPHGEITHDGYYVASAIAGRYSLYFHQPEWYPRPRVIPNVELDRAQTIHIEPALDYAAAFGLNMGPWQGAGDPWDWGTVWHQTFVARGTSITHLGFKVAGTNTTEVFVRFREDNGAANPADWPTVGQTRATREVTPLRDVNAFWRSGEVPTTPGTRYAAELRDAAGSGAIGFFVHRDAVGPGYAEGTAYKDGTAQPYDLYLVIGSDSDGTVIPYMKRVEKKPFGWAGFGQRWGQTWVALGHSLAAMDLFAADGETGLIPGVVSVRADGPDGARVGPEKIARTGWWAPGTGIYGISYNPGEVPLVPGNRYYIEVRGHPPVAGFNPIPFSHSDDAYAAGQAFRDGAAVPAVDLEMTILEYANPHPTVTPTPEPPPIHPDRNLLVNGDMEDGTTGAEGQVPDGWSAWSTRPTAWWFGAYGRDGSNAARVIGGSINGTSIDGGIVQRVAGLFAVHSYQLSGWVQTTQATGRGYVAYVGYDPTGQTGDPRAATIRWTELARASRVWERFVLGPLRTDADALSVWTRGRNDWQDAVYIADFDDFVLEELPPPTPTPVSALRTY